jgi:dUTP pyrophosphatase
MKIMLDHGAFAPTRAHKTDAGLDLYSYEDVKILPHSFIRARTGVHVEIPEGHVGLLTSKSGLMLKGITCRGTIDCGYTGEIFPILFNHSDKIIEFKKGDKVTQLVILPCLFPQMEWVEGFEETERGADGFGSTGR